MSTSFLTIRRTLAQRMDLWGGDPSGTGPGTFSAVDSGGSLTTLIDATRPESDGWWSGAWICINPGGTGNVALQTIWRQLSNDTGFTQPGGVFSLTSPVPSAAYAVQGMTYELFQTHPPQQWLLACNWALAHAYPELYRNVWFEVPEDPPTTIYDWQNLARNIVITDPGSPPVPSAIAMSDAQFPAGTYACAYSYVGPGGETKASPTANVTLTAGQGISFPIMTLPEGSLEIRYYCSSIPGGTVLAELSRARAATAPGVDVAIRPGLVLPDGTVCQAMFPVPPPKIGKAPSQYNQTGLSNLKFTGLRRRINPGRYPEMITDSTPEWFKEEGGSVLRILYMPYSGFAMRFEFTAPPRQFASETDTTDVPEEVIYSGAEQYLWSLIAKTASAQNAQIWKAEAAEAAANYKAAKSEYRMTQKRKGFRRPHISVIY